MIAPVNRPASCDDCKRVVKDLYVLVPGKLWVCRGCKAKRTKAAA